MSNCRLISVVSIVARVMKKLIPDQIYEYLIKSNLLPNSQHGFRLKHSTVTTLLDVSNRWYLNMDIGQLNGVLFLDLKQYKLGQIRKPRQHFFAYTPARYERFKEHLVSTFLRGY